MTPTSKANAFLILATAFWGLTFPLIHSAVRFVNPNVFVFVRFAIAAIVLLPFVNLGKTTKPLLWAGLVLGLLNAGTYMFQTIGLETIDPARSAFITGMGVVIVPFLLPFFRLGWPQAIDFTCGFICLLGLYILTGANLHGISIGDFWTLACAVCFALSVVFVQWVTIHVKNYSLLNFYQIAFTIPVAGLSSVSGNFKGLFHLQVIVALLFCAIFGNAIALFLQLKYQQYSTATKTALIFTLEPVFASIFTFLLGLGIIHFSTIVGGAIILLSLVLPILLSILKRAR